MNVNFSQTISIRCDDPAPIVELLAQWDENQATADIMGYMGIRVLELNVFARMRGNGLSHVRMSTCWEFFKHLLVFRFSGKLVSEMTARLSKPMLSTNAV